MGIYLTASHLLVVVCFTFGAEIKNVVEHEPSIKEDIAPHIIPPDIPSYFDTCTTKKTCGECIRAHPNCVWCASKNMRDFSEGISPRCYFIGKYGCPARDTVNLWSKVEKKNENEYDIVLKQSVEEQLRFAYEFFGDAEYVRHTHENVPDNVEVTYYMKCSGDKDYEIRNECKDIKKGDIVRVEIFVKLLSCPENRAQYNSTIYIHRRAPEKFGENSHRVIRVNIHMLCECPCERPENAERYSRKCSRRGTYHCGACSCYGERFGKECECHGNPIENANYERGCIGVYIPKICCGRGRCRCDGTCECFNKTTAIGPFCQTECPRSKNGWLCSGRGWCDQCGDCRCHDKSTHPTCEKRG